MPDTAQAINRHPLSLSWVRSAYPVLMSPYAFDTSSVVHLRSSLYFSPDLLNKPFPRRSLPWLLTNAARGGLESAPVSRFRRAYLHLPCSYAHLSVASFSHLSVLVAHGESTKGTSPSAARRTVREPLDSYGSHHSTLSCKACFPMCKKPRIFLANSPYSFGCSHLTSSQTFVFRFRPAD